MIEEYLQAKDLRYLTDNDGDFEVRFGYDDGWGCELTVNFETQNEGEIYCVRVWSNKRIPRSDWGRALMLCNTWNIERRWPKMFLYYTDLDEDQTAVIVAEGQVDLGDGTHPDFIDTFTSSIVSGSFSFWKWAHDEKKF